VNGVVRTDLIASEVPPDRGGSKEYLAASRTKAAGWAGEVRKAAGVAWQYRVPGPEDAVADEAAAGLVKAAGARSADLQDLDVFLSDTDAPKFVGHLRESYAKWNVENKQAREDAAAVTAWLANPPPVASTADAVRAMAAAAAHVNQYTGRSRFSDKGKAAIWQLKARLHVVDALAAAADAQYQSAVREKLPLPPGDNAVKTALDTLGGVRAQIAGLGNDLKRADEDKVPVEGALRGAVAAKVELDRQYAAGAALLGLFGQKDLFQDPAGAEPWLRQVAAHYANTKKKEDADLIREKAQQFCDGFLPAGVRLDDTVLLRGKPAPRKEVIVKEPGRPTLSADPDGLNEFKLAAREPMSTLLTYKGDEEWNEAVAPTALSKAAMAYGVERKAVQTGASGPKWTAKSVEDLKKKCETHKDQLDKVKMLEPKNKPKSPDKAEDDEPLKLWVRLSGLAEGIKRAPELFPDR
jgi:hypothetical protein